jgi:hypothetical protein
MRGAPGHEFCNFFSCHVRNIFLVEPRGNTMFAHSPNAVKSSFKWHVSPAARRPRRADNPDGVTVAGGGRPHHGASESGLDRRVSSLEVSFISKHQIVVLPNDRDEHMPIVFPITFLLQGRDQPRSPSPLAPGHPTSHTPPTSGDLSPNPTVE